MLQREFREKTLSSIKKLVESDVDDVTQLSKTVPDIVTKGWRGVAHEIVTADSFNRQAWRPEALALFNTRGLSLEASKEMLKAFFTTRRGMRAETVQGLAFICRAVGRYGFSFPQWRFTSQGFNGTSLIEEFGLTRLNRANDVRDTTLPKWNPQRDEYGVGFVAHIDEWSIEQRRAYIAISNRSAKEPVTIVIRNSSYFFGRDRLEEPCYVSFKQMTPTQLEALDRDVLKSSFSPLHDLIRLNSKISLPEKIRRMTQALEFIDAFDMRLSNWLLSPNLVTEEEGVSVINRSFGQDIGMRHLITFSENLLARKRENPKAPLFYMCGIDSSMPPWKPMTAHALSRDIVTQLDFLQKYKLCMSQYREVSSLMTYKTIPHIKFVLLSSPDGDLPLKVESPTTQKQLSQAILK